jgi:hypothetical protein
MNAEQIFYKVSKHLLEQNVQALGGSGVDCQYLGGGGKKCAIGCLIKKKYYTPGLEGLNLEDEELRIAVGESLGAVLSPEEISLLNSLQLIHDEQAPSYWKSSLRELGEDEGFEYYYEYI